MVKFLGPFKKCICSDGGERGYSKIVQKRTRGGSSSKSMCKPIFFKKVFSHLNCLFLFFTF